MSGENEGHESNAGVLGVTQSFNTLPPKDLIRTAVDLYFEHCHNQ